MENKMNKRLIEELLELLSILPSQQLRKSIHKIFSQYLQTINNETNLEDFKLLVEDFYFLNKFLEKVEEAMNSCFIIWKEKMDKPSFR